jgi:hypothetical protein
MAIQLNERDHLIFRLISEHQVLLEKHIAWFISGEDKPVLIRDRLRKLFYLDYLLCQRHNSKLPWWTTPTKPLVYMLSPISRTISDSAAESLDLFDSEVQRHFLEVANIRMVCLVAKKDGDVEDLSWTTCKSKSDAAVSGPDAIVTLTTKRGVRKIGIFNHPDSGKIDSANLLACFAQEGVDVIGIVSRDEGHQEILRKQISQYADGFDFRKVLLVTHHNLYKLGITKACWGSAQSETIDLIDGSVASSNATMPWGQDIPQIRAASA